ncbi:MAG: polysaccharide biosynthesis tyrosine autokinase [bacterium]|nr:polysaccharide biosynthesis tyrosine autokinase [bacterium]
MAEEHNSKGRSLYYHRYSPLASSGSGPTYGVPAYGGSPMGGAYGGAYGSAYGAPTMEEPGSMSIGRIFRVCAAHWMTIFVFLILGLMGSFVIFQLLPERYEAEGHYEMFVQGRTLVEGRVYAEEYGSAGGGATPLKEVFNTRRELFNTQSVRKEVIDQYRTAYPTPAVSYEEVERCLKEDVSMELLPMSRLVLVTVEAGDPRMAANLTNVYMDVCRKRMESLNKQQADTAVAWLTTMVDQEAAALKALEDQLLELRKTLELDSKHRERDNLLGNVTALDGRYIELGAAIVNATELMQALEIVKDDPLSFGTLPESIPRSAEIAETYQRWQTAVTEKMTLLTRMTESHPDVKQKIREEEVYREQFAETAKRAYDTGKSQLELLRRERELIGTEAIEKRSRLIVLDAQIIDAEMKIQQLERDREMAVEKIATLRQRERVARMKADENAATIEIVRDALPPEEQSSPNPYIVFPAGIAIGLIIGVVFVLLLDHMEDKLVGVSDIEQRLRLKALAVFPHLRRKQRAQVALTMHDAPFSQYAESMAGLRNLLDSPRYHDLTRVILCMSTQPAEGKTCTSTNLAVAYAQSGQRTLLVDFDMRRPRLAAIFGRTNDHFPSLPHILARNDRALFDTLPQETQVPNLHVVMSRASSSISPSVLMGTNVITEFFDWARANYDHIIIDSPPFGLVGDVIVLANLVDAVLLVATPDKTRFGPIQFAARRLTEVGARILGVVVNNVDFGRWAGFGKYETRYGYATATYVPREKRKDTPEELKKAVFTVDATTAPTATTVVADTPDADEAFSSTPEDRPVEDSLASDDD